MHIASGVFAWVFLRVRRKPVRLCIKENGNPGDQRSHKLHGNMAIRGTPNTSSITLVSGSKPPTTGTTLSVMIRPPQASPYTGRVATIVFDFENGAGNPAPVSDFGIGALIGDPGGELFRFTKVSDSRYTCDVRFQKRTGPWTITVKANAATLIADPNVTGPPADTSATINLGIVAPIGHYRRASVKTYHRPTGTFDFRLDVHRRHTRRYAKL